MAQTIACANQKGGVGKTTTVVNLAAYLAIAGERVLIVDLDPQGNATSGFGIDRASLDVTLYDVLVGDTAISATILPTVISNCSIVSRPSDVAAVSCSPAACPALRAVAMTVQPRDSHSRARAKPRPREAPMIRTTGNAVIGLSLVKKPPCP